METFGKAAARKLFEMRGNPETLPMSEEQIAGLIDTAIDFTRPAMTVEQMEVLWTAGE